MPVHASNDAEAMAQAETMRGSFAAELLVIRLRRWRFN
jgi:hypothetical protein